MSPKLKPVSVYAGPSTYAQLPVLYFDLAEHARGLQAAPPALLENLCVLLPGLEAHAGPCGAPACFAAASDAAGGIGHLFEHVCIELQNRAGADLCCVRPQSLVEIAALGAAVPFEDAEVGLAAARLAAELFADVTVAAGAKQAEIAGRIGEFLALAAATMLPVQDRALVAAARALDVPAMRLVGRTIVLGQGRHQQRLSATKTSVTNVVSNDIAANKDYTHRVLAGAGLPVPRYERVHRARDAVAAARRIGYPVVVKPNAESMGAAVSVGMRKRSEVLAAYRRVRQVCKSALVEEVVEGADYRMLVVDGKLRAAARRVPGHVVGDGTHTIEELIVEVNRDPRRGDDHDCWWTRLELDGQAERLLAARGYTRLSVPPAGEIVYLRRNANMSEGGTSIDVTDEVHPDNRAIVERAARAIGLDIAGVDVLSRDISISMWSNGGRICEVNSRPGVRAHLAPAIGKPRDVLTPIIDMLFPAGRPARMPIVAVTGTGDTATTAQMLAQVLAAGGRHVALSAGGCLWSGGRQFGPAGLAVPDATRMVLLDPDADVAVVEFRPDDVLHHGLICDAINVAAVVNADGAGEASVQGVQQQVVDAVRTVARSTRDVVCVADSDPCTDAIERDGGGAELCRVVAAAGSGQGVTAGDAGCRVTHDRRALAVYDGSRERGRVPLAALVKALSGVESASSLYQCAVYAVAAACSLGMEPREVHRALRGFHPLPVRTAAPAARRRRKSRRRAR